MSLSRNFGDNLASQLGKIEKAAVSSARSIERMGEAFQRAQSAVDAIDLSHLNAIGGGGASSKSSSGGGRSGGGDLGGSLVAGLAPLASIGSQITAQLDRVGGTVVTLARRIDDALKKPFFEKLIEEATKAENRIIRVGAKAADAGLRIKHFFTNFGDVAGKGLGQVTDLGKGFQALPAPIQSATSHVKRLGAEIALAVGAFALMYKSVQAGEHFITSGIKGAMNLNETLSKTMTIFGADGKAIVAQADTMAKKFGLVKGEVIDGAVGIANLGKAAGQTDGEAVKLGNTFAQLAANFQSQDNIPTLTEAFDKLRSGLAGESEPLRRFGVLLDEDSVKAYAYANGIAKAGEKLSQAQKVTARTALIQQALGRVNGDLANTVNQPMGAFRKFTGTLTNLANDIGTALLPAIQKGLGLLNEFGAAAVAKWEASQGAFKGFVDRVVYGLGSIEVAFKNWPRVMEAFWLTVHEVFNNFDEAMDATRSNAAIVAVYIADNWANLIIDALNATGRAFINLQGNFVRLGKAVLDFAGGDMDAFSKITWTPLLEGFKATAEKFPGLIKPEFEKIGAAAGKIWDQINKRQSKFAGGLAGAAAGLGRDVGKMMAGLAPPEEKAVGQKEAKDNAALSFGSKEAASAVAKFRNGSDTNAQLLRIQQEALQYLRQAAAALNATRGKKGGAGDLADELNFVGRL